MQQDNQISILRYLPLLVIMVASTVFASDAYLPFLPEMTRALGTTQHMLQLSVGLFILGACCGQIFIGPISDKIGRKPVAIAGFIGLIISTLIAAKAPNIKIFLIARLLQGISATGGMAISRSVMRDLFSGKKLAKSISILSLSNSMTPLLAPVIGAYIGHHFGWRYIFYSLDAVYVVVLIVMWKLLPETNNNKQTEHKLFKTMRTNYSILLRNREFVCYTFVAASIFASLYAYFSCSAFIFQDQLGLTPIQFAWLTLAIIGGSITGRITNFSLIAKFGSRRLMQYGVSLQIIASTLLLIPVLIGYVHIWSLIAAIMLWACSNALLFPNLLAGILNGFPQMAGSAAALYGTIQTAGGAIGSLIIAAFAHKQPIAISITFFTFSIIAATLIMLSKDKTKHKLAT
jgi:Bcr/CflA subfamily drug resistance transporter